MYPKGYIYIYTNRIKMKVTIKNQREFSKTLKITKDISIEMGDVSKFLKLVKSEMTKNDGKIWARDIPEFPIKTDLDLSKFRTFRDTDYPYYFGELSIDRRMYKGEVLIAVRNLKLQLLSKTSTKGFEPYEGNNNIWKFDMIPFEVLWSQHYSFGDRAWVKESDLAKVLVLDYAMNKAIKETRK